MALQFEKIPSEIEIVNEREIEKQTCNVLNEIQERRQALYERTTRCKMIKLLNREPEPDKHKHAYKFICVCPQYHPCYPCKHTGNIIIDRDVLTKEEHICFLSTPRPNFAAPRKQPRFYHKRLVMPLATARIEQLAEPKKILMSSVLDDYGHIISEKRVELLQNKLARKEEDVPHVSISLALEYIAEEKRLQRVAKQLERNRCHRMRMRIVQKQRRQIKKIICVLFEEMKDFLLNDQFLIDEDSMLSKVILEEIREFTTKDFYSTSNLREYQRILANNLAVWINKFISALSIYVAQPEQQRHLEAPEPETFLPVWDYISASNTAGEEYEEDFDTDVATDDDFIDVADAELTAVEGETEKTEKPVDVE